MSRSYLVGVDIGSGACKLTILSSDGNVVATASKEYPTYYPYPSYAEQEPDDWYLAVRDTFAEAVASSGINQQDIAAISVDSATHTAVLTDESGVPLRRAILWTDQRSRKESEELRSLYKDRILEITYHVPDPMWTLPQLLWVKRNEPSIFNKIKRIYFAKDYVRSRLTGDYVTDYIDALGSMFMDARTKQWSRELCEMVGIDPDMLPRIVSPTDIVGTVSAKAAKETGLPEGTPVIAGASDTALEVFGAGAVQLGQGTIKLATAGRICVVTDKAYPHPYLVNYNHVVPGYWYPGTGTKSCATSYRWFRDTFGDIEREQSKAQNTSTYELLDRMASRVPVGSEGLFFHPYLLGELSPYGDPHLKANFVGIGMHHTKAHFARSVLEGVAFSLRDCRTVLEDLGIAPHSLRIIGGGSKSPLWRQIVADVLGTELKTIEISDSSFGGAMLAGVGVGVFSSPVEAAERCVKPLSTVTPDEKNHARYSKMFEIYKEIHDKLADTDKKITGLLEAWSADR
ncbi:MAG TPA: xylulokinase [Bacillota bacterium]|nr:xylulokinase [Bacillota bacterium]